MILLDLNTDIKPWLGIDVLETKYDSLLTTIGDAMEASVINYCETDFQLHVVTREVLDGNSSDVIITRNIPVQSVQAIYFNCDVNGDNGSLIDPLSYQVFPESITLQSIRTPFARSRVRVDYTYGYSGLPSDVKLCLIQCVEAEWRRKAQKSLLGTNISKKDESDNATQKANEWDSKTGLPTVLVYKLNPYRAFEFPCQPMAQRNQ